MKKLSLLSALCIAVIFTQAQNLSFGILGGLGHSWTNIDKPAGYDTRLHAQYSLGGRLVYSFTSNWGVSGDVKFSSEGHTFGLDKDNKTTWRANYIRIPLQGIYFFGKYGDRVRPKVSIGPSFGILVGGKTKNLTNGVQSAKLKTKDYWKTFDFGFTLAAGGNVRVAPSTWLNLDLAYYHGFADVNKVGRDAFNRNISVNAGVTFPLATLRPENLKR